MKKACVHACALLGACVLAIPATAADSYPARPIRLVSPNPPGGANDTIGRIVAGRLAEILGTPVVIDNRGGAGGTIGAEIAARASADGYTLLAGSVSTHSFAPIIRPRLAYDPLGDFAPVSLFAIAHNLLVVHPSVPASDARQLIALAKSRPGTLNYASGGAGSTSHFAIAMFVGLAHLSREMVHVPYKGGAPSIAATVAGETQVYFGPMAGGLIPQVKARRLKAIAVGSATRSRVLPDVPTLAESGLPAYRSNGWFGLFAPKAVPAPILKRLNAAVVDAAGSAEVGQKFFAIGVDPASNTPEAFEAFIREQLAAHRKVVTDLGIRFD